MTTHVISPADELPRREPGSRRKGPAGAWQVWHRGKWVSERAVRAHEALAMAGGDRERAAVALGLSKEGIRGILKVYEDAFREDVASERRLPKQATPKPDPRPEPVPVTTPVEVITQPVTIATPAVVEWHELEVSLPDTTGFAAGYIACLLDVIAMVDDTVLVKALARKAAKLLEAGR